ncbi:MAG TPA: hypothetical protein PKH24_06595 [Sedimentisphaerales bacterium]|jgi:hypothetical protein|nr:hypothetical protein [Sedimentisphaerales bacterium]HNU27772.1 hypothetical protein [Sedimentisphaerales bacterium]
MQGPEHILLALTVMERWEAARQLNQGRVPAQNLTLLALVLLVVLVVLLLWVSYSRWAQSQSRTREVFTENALRRGLGARDRQILLAVVLRSGLRRTHDVFTAVDAFDRGAVKLLAECTRTRTLQENERLRMEIGRLREKLGFQIASVAGEMAGLGPVSSRDVAPGKTIELTRTRPADGLVVRGEVVRNDEIEFAVQLASPIQTRAGDSWQARHYSGLSAWEFDTSTVHCDGSRLTLNHSETVQFTNRRRFPRVAVRGNALIAYLPFRQHRFPSGAVGTSVEPPAPSWAGVAAPASQTPASQAPVFAEGRVTELAGPGLRIQTALSVHPGDRVLVVFTLDCGGAEVPGGWGTVTGIGRVRHCYGADSERSIAVELTGLSDAEIDELAHITAAMSSWEEEHGGQGPIPTAGASPLVGATTELT